MLSKKHVDYYTGSLVHEPPWLKDEPNGEESSNCAFQSTSWQDESCTANANVACACELKKKNAYFVFRGICSNSLLSNGYISFFEVKEDENSIKLKLEITLEWIDDRLTFHNLKNDSFLNTLSEEELKSIWLPLVIYDNMDRKETTRLGENWEWSTSVTVERKGKLRRGGLEYVMKLNCLKERRTVFS